MGSIRKEIAINAPQDQVWAAIRDVGAIHQRLARGFVTNTQLDGDARIVSFNNGVVVRERIVDVDEANCRIAYAVVDGRPSHHHASMQVVADGVRSRIIWITDLLPDDLLLPFGSMIEQGCAAMKMTLEADATASARGRSDVGHA